MRPGVRVAALVAAMVPGAALAWSLAGLPPPPIRLADEIGASLGPDPMHAVTAVLLDFRGYDTLLEVAVLLLAIVAAPPLRRPEVSPGVVPLQVLARPLVVFMTLVAGYLLWAGAHDAGGAFQAAAVLGAAVVLLRLSGLLPARGTDRPWIRAGAAAGLLTFLAIAASFTAHGALLQYPRGAAHEWMLAVEAALTPSLAIVLGSLLDTASGEGGS